MSDRTFAELKSRFAQSCILFGGSREASKNCFPGGSHGKESICNAGKSGHPSRDLQEDPLEKRMTTHSMGHMGPWGHKGWIQLSD